MAHGQANEPERLNPVEPIAINLLVAPVLPSEPVPVSIAVAEVVETPAPGLLNARERQRMDLAMSGLSRFGPVAEPIRPAPRTEVDPLSSVSAADWSGMDGMGEEIAPIARSEPIPTPSRRESAQPPAPAPILEPVAAVTTDPARGWVTAERLFSDFGD